MLIIPGKASVRAERGQNGLDTFVEQVWHRRVSVRAAVTRSPARAMGNVMRGRGSQALRQAGPALRGFSGDSAACSPRCSLLYSLALQHARSEVIGARMFKHTHYRVTTGGRLVTKGLADDF